jgi:hypothetical protein
VRALARARGRAHEDDLVLVAGSTYLAGTLRRVTEPAPRASR